MLMAGSFPQKQQTRIYQVANTLPPVLLHCLTTGRKEVFLIISGLTPDACALMGDVVLQFGPEACFSSSAAHTPIIHQQEGLVVVIQAAGITRCVLDVVLRRKAALYINYIDCN